MCVLVEPTRAEFPAGDGEGLHMQVEGVEGEGLADVVALLLVAHVGAAHRRHPQTQVSVLAIELLPCGMENTLCKRTHCTKTPQCRTAESLTSFR